MSAADALIQPELSEAWKPIPGWEGSYEASDLGRVRSLDRTTRTGRIKGRVLSPGNAGRGYAFYCLSRNGEQRYILGHALIALTFLGPRPDGLQIAHGDGDKRNNAVSNLRYATASENHLDKRAHGANPNVNKTHCPKGHPYSGDNLMIQRGSRMCRTCRRTAERARRAARRAA